MSTHEEGCVRYAVHEKPARLLLLAVWFGLLTGLPGRSLENTLVILTSIEEPHQYIKNGDSREELYDFENDPLERHDFTRSEEGGWVTESRPCVIGHAFRDGRRLEAAHSPT
jgi:hypothetical protein